MFNDTGAFAISGNRLCFIFATEDGTISGWNLGANPKNARKAACVATAQP